MADAALPATVVGGSRSYVDALTAPFADRIRTATPVSSVVRGRSHLHPRGCV